MSWIYNPVWNHCPSPTKLLDPFINPTMTLVIRPMRKEFDCVHVKTLYRKVRTVGRWRRWTCVTRNKLRIIIPGRHQIGWWIVSYVLHLAGMSLRTVPEIWSVPLPMPRYWSIKGLLPGKFRIGPIRNCEKHRGGNKSSGPPHKQLMRMNERTNEPLLKPETITGVRYLYRFIYIFQLWQVVKFIIRATTLMPSQTCFLFSTRNLQFAMCSKSLLLISI